MGDAISTRPTLETVAQFIARAFPHGTIPFPRGENPRDPTASLHYAFNLFDWEAGGEYTLLESRRANGLLHSVWPLWPPDMFAAVATLMEQSGSYLRMVYRGPGPKAPEENEQIFNSASVVDSIVKSRALHFHDRTLKICRIIGALWREGCLFVSGDGGLPSAILKQRMPVIVERMRERCREALEQMEDRFHHEFGEREIDRLCREAVAWYREARLERYVVDGKTKWRVPDSNQTSKSDLILPRILIEQLSEGWSEEDFVRPSGSERTRIESYHGQFETVLVLWAIEFLDQLWLKLAGTSAPYVLGSEFDDEPAQWQVACALLLAIADEASRGIGFTETARKPQATTVSANVTRDQELLIKHNDVVGFTCRDLWQLHAGLLVRPRIGDGVLRAKLPRNLARCVDESVATVMPKARVPAAGCTIRSLSHNLALLPPKGRIRTRWAQQLEIEDSPTFNLLVVPYPFEIRSSDVEPCEDDRDCDAAADAKKEWGRFSIRPGWLKRKPNVIDPSAILDCDLAEEKFVQFIAALIKDQPANVINGIVLPEGALTSKVFEALAKRILDEGEAWSNLTLLTAGLVDRKGGEGQEPAEGNFVATFMRKRGGEKWHIQHVRSKHHRWSLNKAQLASYALSNRLRPDRVWWENIDLPPREMLFAEFSRGSVLTSLICEDLARIDPCQAALRAVGPNLTLVLLMDSAQITSRWPAQYAGVLADDPGTSVLTLTSFGLLRRSNLSDGHSSRSIALWREPQGKARQIDLPIGFQAQLLCLRRERIREVTLDGRGDGTSAISWSLAGVVPIRVNDDKLPPGYPRD
jgi:hypothetical protein